MQAIHQISKDIKFIIKVMRAEFQFVATLKLSVLPILPFLTSFISSLFGWVVPTALPALISFVLLLLIILILVARHGRKHEDVIFDVLFDDQDSKFRQVVSATPTGSGPHILLRVKPVPSRQTYSQAILNCVEVKSKENRWTSTPYHEARDMTWGIENQTSIMLAPSVNQYLNVIEVFQDGTCEICTSAKPIARPRLAGKGTYKLEIILTDNTVPVKRFYMHVHVGQEWNELRANIENVPL